jgi:hypothetical protein
VTAGLERPDDRPTPDGMVAAMPGHARRTRASSRVSLLRLLRPAAGIMPPARRDSARAAFSAIRHLLAGAPPRSWNVRAGEPPLDPRRLAAIRSSLDAGRLQRAIEEATAILATHPEHVGALELRSVAHERAGELSASLRDLVAVCRLADTPQRAARARAVGGAILASDPAWLPRIPGAASGRPPAVDGRIMHLCWEPAAGAAGPGLGDVRDRLAAERRRGLDPVVVVAPGSPALAGRATPASEAADGVRVYRLDAVPGYPADVPADRYLEDVAWLASRVVEAARPAVLVVETEGRHEIARVALALRARHATPVVLVLGEDAGRLDAPPQPATELERRRQALAASTAIAVDSVVVEHEAVRDRLLENGVPASAIVVVDAATDAVGRNERVAAAVAEACARATTSPSEVHR